MIVYKYLTLWLMGGSYVCIFREIWKFSVAGKVVKLQTQAIPGFKTKIELLLGKTVAFNLFLNPAMRS